MQLDIPQRLPLPISVSDDESGYGAILRAAARNGLQASKLTQLCGSKGMKTINPSQAKALAWMTNLEPDWLRDRLPIERRDEEQVVFHILSHVLSSFSFKTAFSACVCPACLRETGRCSIAWMLRSYCCCPVHQTMMVEKCGRCSRRITWDRPDTTTCACGWSLLGTVANPCTDPRILTWCAWLTSRLANQAFGRNEHDRLPFTLDALSIDGAFRVLLAFGLLEDQQQTADLRKRRGTDELAPVISRGLRRLQAFELEDQLGSSSWGLIHIPALESLARRSVLEADHMFASSLLARWHSTRFNKQDMRGRFSRGQRSLF